VAQLVELVPGRIWLCDYPVRYAGTRFRARTTVLRLDGGDLLVHSPCPIDAALVDELAALGPVAHIVAVVARALRRILDWDFERVVIAHGDVIERDAKAVVRKAWETPLRAAPREG
jgi:hypothetical protein